MPPIRTKRTSLDAIYFDGRLDELQECCNAFATAVQFSLASADEEHNVLDAIAAMPAGHISPDLHRHYASNLRRAVDNVFGTARGSALAPQLRASVNRFAAYKAHTASRIIAHRMQQGNREAATLALRTFNRYQAAEYNTTASRARSAQQFAQFSEPDRLAAFPCIQWLPSRSVQRRPDHQEFYHRVWAKDDPFWHNNQPGNLWNCKCHWREVAGPPSEDNPSKGSHSAPGLDGNPALTGQIFTDGHPYIARVPEGDRRRVETQFMRSIMRPSAQQALRALRGQRTSVPLPDGQVQVEYDSTTAKHIANDIVNARQFLWYELIDDLPRLLSKSEYVGAAENLKTNKKPNTVRYLYFRCRFGEHTFFCNIEEQRTPHNRAYFRLYSITKFVRDAKKE